jgi:hypothetical protein
VTARGLAVVALWLADVHLAAVEMAVLVLLSTVLLARLDQWEA